MNSSAQDRLANEEYEVHVLKLIFAIFLSLSFFNSNAQETVREIASTTCGPSPGCVGLRECELRKFDEQRDTRDCNRKISIIFQTIRVHDPACEARKAAQNQELEARRAAAQQDYRQCLVTNDSKKLNCEILQTRWESCISKELPEYPPKSIENRRSLYTWCIALGGKDEFTNECCSHLYTSDKALLGLCDSQNNPLDFASQEEEKRGREVITFISNLRKKVQDLWETPAGTDHLSTTLRITLGAQGDVNSLEVLKPSTNLEFDRQTQIAVQKAAPFPMPSDQITLRRVSKIVLEFSPYSKQ